MELWYLFVLIALVLAVFLVGTQIMFMIRSRRVRKSRENLRTRAAGRSLSSSLFAGGRVIGHSDELRAASQSLELDEAGRGAEPDQMPVSSMIDASLDDHDQSDVTMLRNRLQERDETVSQLQQVVEELSTTTATRESVNFLQKQLLVARTTVQQQEAELKQLRRDKEQRFPAACAMPISIEDEQESRRFMKELEHANHAMKQQLAEQSKRAAIEAQESRQNALEVHRLRSELESVQADRATAKANMAELQVRVDEQQNALDQTLSQRVFNETMTVASQPVENEPAPIAPIFVPVDEQDDLKAIKGIGPVLEQRLNALGITSFRQLAKLSGQDIDAIAAAIGVFRRSIERDDWIGKARELVMFSKDTA